MISTLVVVATFLSAPTFAIWRLTFLNAKPAWREADDAAEGGMENDMSTRPRPRVDGLLTSDSDRASRSSAMASIDIQVEEGGGGVVGW